jgi:GTP-binding protein
MAIDFQHAFFQLSATKLSQCPADIGVEVAFIGRSNAGKSSLINTLCQQKKLARTSKTPGRTQLLNFFSLNELGNARLVDLPGYGFAKVSHAMRESWDIMLENYLKDRQSLKLLVIVMDSRHPLQESDKHMIAWSLRANIPVHLALTKADKLSRGQAGNTLLKVKSTYQDTHFVSSQLFSSMDKTGVDELAQRLRDMYE